MIKSAQQLQADTAKRQNIKPLENMGGDRNFRSGDEEDSLVVRIKKN